MNERGLLIGQFCHRATIDSADYRVGKTNRYIVDDPVTEPPSEPPSEARMRDVLEKLHAFTVFPDITHGGAYRNRFGELVTWDANVDGSYVKVQTWPGE